MSGDSVLSEAMSDLESGNHENLSDDKILALMESGETEQAEAQPEVNSEQPEEVPEDGTITDDSGAETEADTESDTVPETAASEGVMSLDDLKGKLSELGVERIDTGDGNHKFEDLMASHSYVQKRLNEQSEAHKKELDSIRSELSPAQETLESLKERMKLNPAGFLVDTASLLGADAQKRIAGILVNEFGINMDKAENEMLRAQMQKEDKPKSEKLGESEVLAMRRDLEYFVARDMGDPDWSLNDSQWSAIHHRADEIRSKDGGEWEKATAQALVELYPSVVEKIRERKEEKPPGPKQKPQPAHKPSAQPARSNNVEALSDKEIEDLFIRQGGV